MPRIRPPRQEALAVKPEPLPNEDVTFNLDEPQPTDPVEVELAPQEEPQAPQTPASPSATEPQPPAAPPKDEDAAKRLLEADRRAEALQRQLAEEQRRSQVREQELSRDRDDAQYNHVLSSIGAEQNALEKAEGDYAAFAAANDWANAAKAQRAMAVASSRLDRLEDMQKAFETRREEIKRQPTPPPAPAALASQSVDQQIESLRVPPVAKDYLRSHPELISDAGKRERINKAHDFITDVRGIAQFSPEYFEAMDQAFGFKAPAPTQQEPEPAPARRSMPVSAPVSRQVPTPQGKRVGNSVTLTPEEREIARNSFGPIKGPDGRLVDLTPAEKERLYAMNKADLHRKRASGEYRQTTEQTG